MSNPRLRRLTQDAEKIARRFEAWPFIHVSAYSGDPAEVYHVTYRFTGLSVSPTGAIQERHEHILEIRLSLAYPRRAPQCKMLTPIFHPNFDEASVCIGDFWAASEGLDDLVVRIGRMITYQEYNIKSPLNGLAAKWTAEHESILPVYAGDVAPPLTTNCIQTAERIVVRSTVDSVEALHANPNDELSVGEPRLDVAVLNFGSISIQLQRHTTVGRAAQNTIRLDHPSVSAHHAEIIDEGGSWHLRDLVSTNGTMLNGSSITFSKLSPGDSIHLGDFETIFLIH